MKMTNTHAIAANLAANIRPTRAPVCPWCGKPAHVKMCAPLRAVMKEKA